VHSKLAEMVVRHSGPVITAENHPGQIYDTNNATAAANNSMMYRRKGLFAHGVVCISVAACGGVSGHVNGS